MLKRALIGLSILFCALCAAPESIINKAPSPHIGTADAAFASFQASIPAPSFTPAWQPLSIGAGGQITAIYNYADNTTLIRTDTYSGYEQALTGTCTYGARVYTAPCWRSMVTATSIPSLTIDMANGAGGVTELVAAPSNTSVRYMLWQGFLYVTVNKGVNWFKTTQTTTDTANNGYGKGRYIDVDPNNPDIVIIGTPAGVFRSINGTASATSGTTTFSAISGLATPSGTKPVAVPVFQLGSSTHILIGITGTGVYESTNGTSFSLTTGSHATFSHIVPDKFNQFLMTDNGSTSLYKYASSTWATITPGGSVASVAVDPNSASVGSNHIVVTDFNGQLNISNDNGATWTGLSTNQTASATGSQPAWLGNANQTSGTGSVNLNGYSLAFDQSSNLMFAGGLGVWNTAAPVTASTTPWTANSLGIEQLVTIQVVSALGGAPVAGVWDKGFFTLRNPDVFPSIYWNNNSSLNAILGGWAYDWASNDPTFGTGWESSNISSSLAPASSTNSANTFTGWASVPSHVGVQGGVIAALTNQKWALVTSPGEPMVFTTNGAGSWATSTISGTPTDWVGNTGVGWPLAADRVAADTYCAFRNVSGTITFYTSTNAGANLATTAATVDGSINQSFVRSAPGHAGHFWFTSGGHGPPHPGTTRFWKSTDTCVSFSSVSASVGEVIAFGFGAAPPSGGTYGVTVYFYGYYNSVLGFYQSIDGGTTWTPVNIPASQTPWPLNSADLVTWVEGDANVYGRIYVGFRGSGAAYIDTADACPWVNYTTVTPNQALSGTVTLTAQHSGLVPVTGVTMKVDSTTIATFGGGNGPFTTSWNASGITPGAHTLSVIATGNSGGGCSTNGTFTIPITTSANDNWPLAKVA